MDKFVNWLSSLLCSYFSAFFYPVLWGWVGHRQPAGQGCSRHQLLPLEMPPCKTRPSTPVPCSRVHLWSRRPPVCVGQLGEHWPAELPDCQGLHHQSHRPPEQGRAGQGEISTECCDILVCTHLFFTASRKMGRCLHSKSLHQAWLQAGGGSSQIHKVMEIRQ